MLGGGVNDNIHGGSQQPRKLRDGHKPVKDLELLSKVLYNKHSSQPTKRGGMVAPQGGSTWVIIGRIQQLSMDSLFLQLCTMNSRMLSRELYGETATKGGLKYLGNKSTPELKKVTRAMAAARTTKTSGQIQASIIDPAV